MKTYIIAVRFLGETLIDFATREDYNKAGANILVDFDTAVAFANRIICWN